MNRFLTYFILIPEKEVFSAVKYISQNLKTPFPIMNYTLILLISDYIGVEALKTMQYAM